MPTQALLDALFDVGDQILGIERKGGELSPRSQLSMLVAELLRLWGPLDAAKHLKVAFDRLSSPAFSAAVFADRARELGLMPSRSSLPPPLITKADLDELGTRLLSLIERAANNGTLANAPFYWDIARSWELIGDGAAARAWISAGMQRSAEFLVKVVKGFVSISVSSSQLEYALSEKPNEDLYDLNVLLDACKNHLILDVDDRRMIEAVKRAVEHILAEQHTIPSAERASARLQAKKKPRPGGRG